jgi:hypothetical protein
MRYEKSESLLDVPGRCKKFHKHLDTKDGSKKQARSLRAKGP